MILASCIHKNSINLSYQLYLGVVLILSIFAGIYHGGDKILEIILKYTMAITETNSQLLETWDQPPYVSTFDIFIWNLTNPEGVKHHNEKPALVQVGPIAYDYFIFRRNVSFSDNGTVFYNNFQQFVYNHTRSTIAENATIFCVNVPFATISSILGKGKNHK